MTEPDNWYQFLDSTVKREWVFRVADWRTAVRTIRPRRLAVPKTVDTLWIDVHPEDREPGRKGWRTSSRKLIATLLPLLPSISGTGTRVRIQSSGEPPSTEFTVTLEPPTLAPPTPEV